MEGVDKPEGTYKTPNTEFRVTGEFCPIKLEFPGFWKSAVHKFLGYSIKIDRCRISYTSQVPFNAVGNIRLIISDNRLQLGDEDQAEFVFAVGMNCEIMYYGTAFSSLKDEECPWKCRYRVEESNLKSGIHFCKISATLQITAERIPSEVVYRAPTIKVRSKMYSDKDVNYIHVAKKKNPAPLCRSLSSIEISRAEIPQLPPGQTFQQNQTATSGEINQIVQRTNETLFKETKPLQLPKQIPNPPQLTIEPKDVISGLGKMVIDKITNDRPISEASTSKPI